MLRESLYVRFDKRIRSEGQALSSDSFCADYSHKYQNTNFRAMAATAITAPKLQRIGKFLLTQDRFFLFAYEKCRRTALLI